MAFYRYTAYQQGLGHASGIVSARSEAEAKTVLEYELGKGGHTAIEISLYPIWHGRGITKRMRQQAVEAEGPCLITYSMRHY